VKFELKVKLKAKKYDEPQSYALFSSFCILSVTTIAILDITGKNQG
jgi:hypothetical protein